MQTAAALELMRQFPLTRVNANRRPPGVRQRAVHAVHGAMPTMRSAATRPSRTRCSRISRSRGNIDAGGRRDAGLFLAAGLLRCRMYADWPQFRRGWKRIYTEAANRKREATLGVAAWRIRALGTFLPICMFGCGASSVRWSSRAMRRWAGRLLALGAGRHSSSGSGRIAARRLDRACAAMDGTLAHRRRLADRAGPAERSGTDLRSRTPTRWGGRDYEPRRRQGLTPLFFSQPE